ncbi:uncharacterized protein METZ01_LOCUS496261, partial [marine metagenome]
LLLKYPVFRTKSPAPVLSRRTSKNLISGSIV